MFNLKKTSLAVLGMTSLVCSRVMFLFINDPEGPNLLVVVVMAAILYILSLGVYALIFSKKDISPSTPAGVSKFPRILLIQILVTIIFYFYLR